MMRRATGGFTLLEVLAALALLALLMVGVYAGIRTATVSVRAGSALIERSDQIRSAQQFLRRELAQSLTQALGRTQRGEPIVFVGTAREMRYVAPLPGYLGRLGPQVQRLQLVDDGAGGLRLELSLALLPPDGEPPASFGTPQVLLDHIVDGQFGYNGLPTEGGTVTWPQNWVDGRELPQLVRIALRPGGNLSWPDLDVPLRVTAAEAPASTGVPRMQLPGGDAR